MTLRKFLVIPFLASLALFAIYSNEITNDLREILGSNYVIVEMIFLIGLSVSLLLIGHVLRAYKLRYLMQPVRDVSLGQQFRALTVGYLFNTILPFRLGELIRAQIVSSSQSLSYGFTLLMIILERFIDLVILVSLAGLLVGIGYMTTGILPYIIVSLLLCVLVALVLWLVVAENRVVMGWVHFISKLFNEKIKVNARFKYWSIMYGAQRVLSPRRIAVFVAISMITWFLYVSSIFIMLSALSSSNRDVASVTAPLYSMSIPLGPANLGSYSSTYGVVANRDVEGDTRVQALSTWALLVIPTGLVGLYNLARTREPAWRKISATKDINALNDKLARDGDISHELELFLDNYLSGNSLSRIVNRLERSKSFSLIKYFKGGSDAVTILANEAGRVVVKKIIAIELKDRLKAQYDWLRSHQDDRIVKALSENTSSDHYDINLEYDESNGMFFDYLHEHTIEDSKRILDDVWKTLFESVHSKTVMVTDIEGINAYIDKHVFGCLDQSISVSEDLSRAVASRRITINGKEYDNIYTIMDKIMRDGRIMKDLATYKSSGTVHGDVAVDNILVSQITGKVMLIDPAPDGNIINGPVFDFGKNMQSLYCGYEFLFRSVDHIELNSDGSINYSEKKSLQYTQLCDYVQNVIAPKRLTKGEQRAIIFHAGVLHIRRLKHQVYQDPRLTLAMYGVGVRTLNEFYDLYEK